MGHDLKVRNILHQDTKSETKFNLGAGKVSFEAHLHLHYLLIFRIYMNSFSRGEKNKWLYAEREWNIIKDVSSDYKGENQSKMK